MSHLSTKAVDLLYENNLLIITIKAKSVIDQADVLEFVEGAKQLVRRETFATLIDGREEHFMMQSAQELLSKTKSPTRVGMAILTNEPMTEARVDQYIQKVEGTQLTRRFNDYDTAVNWLKSLLP